jgi:predicted membrane-bound mannosyltransferase
MTPSPHQDRGPAAASSRPVLCVLLIALVAAAFFVPGLGRVHLFDWDEANFAEASREMIERNNYLQVTIDYEPFYQKPPLFLWLQVLSMKAFGQNEFAARFVNAICGVFTLVLLFLIGRRLRSPLFGLLWALAFFGSFLPHLFFKSGIIDPVFNLLIFLGLCAIAVPLMNNSTRRRTGWYALAGLSIGLAVLAKGPVAPLVACLVMFVYWATVRFRPFFSILDLVAFFSCVAAVSALFFGIETTLHGTVFVKKFIAYQIKLFSTGDSGHGRPFYFHFFVILFGCFPASFFAIPSFFRRDRADDAHGTFNRLMLILFWTVLILFSIVKTKTVLYSSLTYFPLTYLAALFVYRLISRKQGPTKSLVTSLALFGGLVSIAITLFPVIIMRKEHFIPLIKDAFTVACLQNPVYWTGYEFLLGVFYAAAITAALVLFIKNRPAAASVTIFGSSAVCLLLFLYIFGPKIEQYSQGGPVTLYQQYAGKEVYVRAIFKSYVDLFYSRKKPGENPLSHNKEWLLRGDIDKPAYFVARITQAKPYEDTTRYHLIKLKEEYGFVYYKRNIPIMADTSGSTIEK